MKLVIATAWNDAYQPMADISVPLMQRYCERHGYDLAAWEGGYHTNEVDLLTYGDRVKIHMYKRLYDSYDAFVWIDVDTLIMDPRHEIWRPHSFLWTYDPTGPVSGFFVARCNEDAHMFLHQAQHKSVEMKSEIEPCGVAIQDAMRKLMVLPPFKRIQVCVPGKQVGHCYFDMGYYGWERYSKLSQYEKGDMMVTFPAVPVEQRIDLMKQWAQEAT